MVRVGGGWVALDEFLVKNDPCRGKRGTKKVFIVSRIPNVSMYQKEKVESPGKGLVGF